MSFNAGSEEAVNQSQSTSHVQLMMVDIKSLLLILALVFYMYMRKDRPSLP